MTRSPSPAEQQRRSQIAASAYQRGRRAALAAARRRALPDRAAARRDEVRSRSHSYEPRSDSRAFGLLDSNASLVRAAAYLAAAGVAHELVTAQTVTSSADQSWIDDTSNRTAVHEEAWRDRLVENGIDDAVLHPGLSDDALDDLPTELAGLDFDGIAEHTLDVSATSSDAEPIRLADLMLDTPRRTRSTSGAIVDITDRVIYVIELDRDVDSAIDGGMGA